LGNEFDKDELNIKVLNCLDRSWKPKVKTISELRDLSTITIAALFGKLREHGIEMNKLNEQESSEKKLKNIALKSSIKKDENEEDVAESSENENENLLVKKFGKYLKRRGNKGNQRRYNSKRNDSNSTHNFTCYNCEKLGHIKIECPNMNPTKGKGVDRKKESKPKERCAYIAWEDGNDLTSSSSQERSEESNLCLMVGCELSSSSQVSSLSSKDKHDYYKLLHGFEELHDETNKIVVINNRLRGLNN